MEVDVVEFMSRSKQANKTTKQKKAYKTKQKNTKQNKRIQKKTI